LVRAYAQITNELEAAGYTTLEAAEIRQTVTDYKNLRDVIRSASGEYLDLKPYEADMRHLIDTYIEADAPRPISEFEQLPLIDLIIKTGIQETINHLPPGIRNNRRNIAETIENNVRRVIVQEQLNDPAYYAQMSALLDDLIQTRKREAIAYEELLKRYAELAQKVRQGKADDTPSELDTPGKLALYNNLEQNLALALNIDATVKQVRLDDWRGNKSRENTIKKALFDLLNNGNEVERIFVIIKNQPEY
jgi:type I restriction enzyme R subunit